MLVEALVFIAAALSIAFLILHFSRGNASYQGQSAVYNLATENNVVLPRTVLPWTSDASTIRFGIYVEGAPKTLAKVDCVPAPSAIGTERTKFGPSCEDYSFKVCQCEGANCNQCNNSMKNDDGNYLSRILSCGPRIQLWASGYTSENDKPFVPAILKVETAKNSNQHYIESVQLPAIPLQKWTIITIVKEGRRFDIYYGTQLVASSLTQYIPVPADGSFDWEAGNRRWKGKIGFFNGFQSAFSANEVKEDVSTLVNSRGIPFYIEQPPMDFSFKVPTCALGTCNVLPEVKPLNPFVAYSSNVS